MEAFFDSALHNSEVLFFVDTFYDFGLAFVGDVGDLFDFGVVGGFAFDAGIDAIGGSGRLIRHNKKQVGVMILGSIEGGEVLRQIVVNVIPIDRIKA